MLCVHSTLGFPGGSVVKNLSANARDPGSIPGSGRSLEEEMAAHSRILAWEIPWQAPVHRVRKSWTRLSTGAHVGITFGLPQCGVCHQTPFFSCVLLICTSVGDHLFVFWFLHMYIRMPPYTYILIRMHTLCLT